MSVEFDTDEHAKSALYAQYMQQQSIGTTTGLAGWLINKGIVNSPQAANGVLIAVMVVSIVVTGWTLKRSFLPAEDKRREAIQAKIFEESSRNLPPIKIRTQ